MEIDLFKSLKAGTNFATTKNKDHVQFFKRSAPLDVASARISFGGAGPAKTLDFFGQAPSLSKPRPEQPRRRTSSIDIPGWAGGTPVRSSKEGSKQRKKRKLSEEVIAADNVERERLKLAAELMRPKKSRKARRKKGRSSSDQDILEEEDEDGGQSGEPGEKDDGASGVALFKGSRVVADESKKKRTSAEEEQIRQEEDSYFRHRMNIHVSGSHVPSPCPTFSSMDFSTSIKGLLLKNIEESAFKEPTPIQMQAIPAMLEGLDTVAIAPTGSGKTAAYALPILSRLGTPRKGEVRAIVLAPTRELAKQIHAEFSRFAKGKKFKISLLTKATASTASKDGKHPVAFCDVLISTPLRLLHLLQVQGIDISRCEILCMDEADKLLEMGFLEQVDEILNTCGTACKKAQRCMFSATMLQGVEQLAQTVLRDPVKVSVGVKNAGADTIDQRLIFCGREEGKLLAIRQLFQEGFKPPVLIFLQSKERAKQLYNELVYDGFHVDAIHADRTQEQRDSIIRRFRMGEIWVLICTDLLARGIDFKGVNMVINYDLPQSVVSYIHRIGRTGRAGRKGVAITLYTEADMQYLRSIANVMKLSGSEVPDWMMVLKKPSHKKKKKLEKGAPVRKKISTVAAYDIKKTQKRRQTIEQNRRKKDSTSSAKAVQS